jgi:hypothetical protein
MKPYTFEREKGFVSLDYALNNPKADVIFPNAKSQKLRCAYWNTSNMNRNDIRESLDQVWYVSTNLMSNFNQPLVFVEDED